LTFFQGGIYNGFRWKKTDRNAKLYPYLRLSKILIQAKFGSSRNLDGESVLKLRVFSGDIDFYPELNNGRHLTLMDLGRLDLAQRTGLMRLVHEQKWGFAVTGASVRFRHRLKAFKRFELHTRIVAIDDRWFYFHQNTIRKGKIHSSALIRAGITGKQGLIPVKKVLQALGRADWNPGMPKWIKAWSDAEELRPWNSEEQEP
jgi:acyl-CoA thioesterase FadM